MAYEDTEPRREAEEPELPAVTSGKAITALVLGLLSFCFPLLLSVAAIVFGILGLGDVKRGRGRVRGQGLAITGLVLGAITLVLFPISLAVLLPAVQKVREAAARTQEANNLKQIALALHNYHDVYKQLPPATVYAKDGRPLYSWRVLLLGYLEQENLYKLFHLDEAWDSPHNLQFVKQIPPVYVSPFDLEEPQQGLTRYQVFVADGAEPGPRPIFVNNPLTPEPFHLGIPGTFQTKGGALSPLRMPDGSSFTILVAAAARPVPWTQPADLAYSNRGPLPQLATYGGSTASVALADASTRRLDLRTLSEKTLRNAITADDGQALGPDW